MKLLELAITMSYDAKVNFEDVYSQVRMWDTMIYNYLTDRKVVVPLVKVRRRMKIRRSIRQGTDSWKV